MSKSTCLESIYKFCRAVVYVFARAYLREPNAADIAWILSISESIGFTGMLGCIDYMHWKCKNYQFAWQRQLNVHVEGCTVILETVASQDLWIWHSFFGIDCFGCDDENDRSVGNPKRKV
jgi:hypothetical protein